MPLKQILKFGLVGAINTIVAVATYAGLLAAGFPYFLAAAIAYGAGILNGFIFNNRWTFTSNISASCSLPRYIIVQVAALSLSAFATMLLVEFGNIAELHAQILCLPAVMALSFITIRSWVFK